jgi:hypothetical protein
MFGYNNLFVFVLFFALSFVKKVVTGF